MLWMINLKEIPLCFYFICTLSFKLKLGIDESILCLGEEIFLALMSSKFINLDKLLDKPVMFGDQQFANNTI